jgi:RecA-family ATPase
VGKIEIVEWTPPIDDDGPPPFEDVPFPDEPPDGPDWTGERVKTEPLATVTPASWRGTPIPEERWLASNRIPGDDLTIYSGDGGAGKTETALQLCAHVAAGVGDWLGCVIETGTTLFFSAEEPEVRFRKRVNRICRDRGLDPYEIENLHLYFPDLEDTVLATTDRNGKLRRTPLMDQLEKTIKTLKPCLVVIDNVAAVFDSEAKERRQVRRFCAILRKMALKYETAIMLLDHPSLRGMTDGSGTANSVDWRNSARAMLYLSGVKDDPDERLLEVTKNNDGRVGEKVKVRWNGTTFTTAGMAGPSPTKAKAERQIDELFLKLLDKRNTQGRPVHSKKAAGGAPSEFAADPDANGTTRDVFRKSMERLLTAGKIVAVSYGSESKRRERLERPDASISP